MAPSTSKRSTQADVAVEEPTSEEQTGLAAAAAGATSPKAAKGDPTAHLEDGGSVEVDAFGKPAPGGTRVFRKNGKSYIHCLIRDRDLRCKPEEWCLEFRTTWLGG